MLGKKWALFALIVFVGSMILTACEGETVEVTRVVEKLQTVVEKETVVEKVVETVVEKETIIEEKVQTIVETVVETVLETVVVTEEVEVPAEEPEEEAYIESQLPVEISRDKVYVVDQIYRYAVVGNFNHWMSGAGETPIQHGLMLDTLWYIDQETGEWINSLAVEKPTYNDDFTQMTVKLREGVYWSDGVEFTADDYVFTCKLLKDHPGMSWSAELGLYMEDVSAPDKYTLVFDLTETNPRFHYYFAARWNGVYPMPKHIWEEVEDPMTFTFNPPVVLGAYTWVDADPAGYWNLFKRRDDWERTTAGMITGKPGPENVLIIFYGGSERKVIAMARHELDVFMNVDYEAFQALLDSTPSARSWFKEFPYAYPNELDGRWFGWNYETQEWANEKDVRWALALALDIVDLHTEYIGGVSRITPIPQPATTYMMENFHVPLEPWLKELEIEVADGETFKPYDETVPQQVGEWAAAQGYSVPTDVEGLRDRFGMGWWKHAPDVAEKLLLKHGFSRNDDGMWLLPDGTPWSFTILAAPDEVDVYRLAIGSQDQWTEFGIQVEVNPMERNPYYTSQQTGDFEVLSAWSGSSGMSVNATTDKWQSIAGMHSRWYVPSGESTAGTGSSNEIRLKDPEIDRIIDELAALHPDDPQVLELGREWMKLYVENMYVIPTISFKKFITIDETYWTGFPTSENVTYQPLYWFHGGKFTFPQVEPVK
jgi:peptide/nickel transport system substrate-binding protein